MPFAYMPAAFAAAVDPRVPLAALIDVAQTDPHQTDDRSQTLLFPACQSGSLEKAQWLVGQGLDIDHRDPHGYSPLIFACLQGTAANLDLVRFLLAGGADPDASSSYNESPLRLATRTGNYTLARLLIGAGARPGPAGFSPLHQAAAAGDRDAVDHLVSPQTLEARDTWGRTPWLTAVHADRVDIARHLQSLGADTTATARLGKPALGLAAGTDAHDAVRYLLDLGFDPDTRDEFQHTALHDAAEHDALRAAAVLVEAGADIDARSRR